MIRQKRRGKITNARMAEAIKVPVLGQKALVQIRGLWAQSHHVSCPHGPRPGSRIPGRGGHPAALSDRHGNECGAHGLEGDIEEDAGLHIPHNTCTGGGP